jgi:heterodisulfide reductase subunit C
MSIRTNIAYEERETIRSSEFEPKFAEEVKKHPGGEKLSQCFQCGACAGSCPVGKITGSYNPRKILRMTMLGLRREVLSSDSIWLCALCYTCQERCSQGVEIADIILALRNLAVSEGYAPKALVEQAVSLIENGRLAAIVGSTDRLRTKLGLPKISTSSKDIIKKIVVTTGFDKLVENMRGN